MNERQILKVRSKTENGSDEGGSDRRGAARGTVGVWCILTFPALHRNDRL
jgi:hypothetical protein